MQIIRLYTIIWLPIYNTLQCIWCTCLFTSYTIQYLQHWTSIRNNAENIQKLSPWKKKLKLQNRYKHIFDLTEKKNPSIFCLGCFHVKLCNEILQSSSTWRNTSNFKANSVIDGSPVFFLIFWVSYFVFSIAWNAMKYWAIHNVCKQLRMTGRHEVYSETHTSKELCH